MKAGVSTDLNERAECKRQLNKITGAIREYRKNHGTRPPDRLSDLNPDYIHDPDVLVCPFVQKRGGLRTWTKRFDELSADPYTSYQYDFPPEPVDAYRWRGLPKKTWREVKERQAELVGDVVPIVRCHDHFPWLNLAVGGAIYESESLFWELNFVENEDLLMNRARLFPSRETTPPPRPDDFPPRDPQAQPQWLDLTRYYNAMLTNSWQGFAGNDLASLPIGIQELDGVKFDVRGVIQLRGVQMPAMFPWRVDGIQVRQKCARIHFLHALSWIRPLENPQAVYSMHYEDGLVEEFTIVYGQHIADWWYDPRKPEPPSSPRVAWSGQNEAAKAYGMAIRLFHAVWDNPRKDVEIKSISFDAVYKRTLAGPFVIAITLE